jgi:hypothetical protein
MDRPVECRSSLPNTAAHMSDGSMQQLPHLAQRVRVLGREIPFFVVSVDEDAQTVDLIPVSGSRPTLEDVPFSELVFPDTRDSSPAAS